MLHKMEKWFVNKNVLYLSLSAFFADAGYQAVIALFLCFSSDAKETSARLAGLLESLAHQPTRKTMMCLRMYSKEAYLETLKMPYLRRI